MNTSMEILNAYVMILYGHVADDNDIDESINTLIESGYCHNINDAAETILDAVNDYYECYKTLPTITEAVNTMLEGVVSKDLTSC